MTAKSPEAIERSKTAKRKARERSDTWYWEHREEKLEYQADYYALKRAEVVRKNTERKQSLTGAKLERKREQDREAARVRRKTRKGVTA